MSFEAKPTFTNQKHFVADQPGWSVFFAGFLVAVLLGLFVKSQISSEKIKPVLDRAISKLHTNAQVKFATAYVSLSNGVWPELSVVVEDLSLEATDNCLMSPLLEINQLRLPLIIGALFKGKVKVEEVNANEVDLSLRSDLSSCRRATQTSKAESVPAKGSANPSAVKAPESSEREPQSDFSGTLPESVVREISIDTLRVHYLPVAFTSFLVRDFRAQLPTGPQRKLEISGLLNIGGETLSGDYSSRSQLKLNYEENQSPDWILDLQGTWREGQYTMKTQFNSADQSLNWQLDTKHIPVGQILPLLKKYHWINGDFNAKRVWISGRASASGFANRAMELPLKLSDVRLEGDVGEIEIPLVEFSSLQPLRAKPSVARIRSLKINELLKFSGRPHPGAYLGSLGVFQGELKYDGERSVVLQGEHSGLEFIFANQGGRQTQTVSLMSGVVRYQAGRWDLIIEKVKPSEGLFIGDVKVSANESWKNVQVRAQIEDLSLSPAVQKLMTQGGNLGSLSGDFALLFDQGKPSDLRGALALSEMTMENFKIHRPRFSFASEKEQVSMDFRCQSLSFTKDSPAYRIFSPALKNFSDDLQGVEFSSFAARLKTMGFRNFQWKDLVARGSSLSLRSQGGWNEEGQLSGDMDLSYKRERKKFVIRGHRDQPIFEAH